MDHAHKVGSTAIAPTPAQPAICQRGFQVRQREGGVKCRHMAQQVTLELKGGRVFGGIGNLDHPALPIGLLQAEVLIAFAGQWRQLAVNAVQLGHDGGRLLGGKGRGQGMQDRHGCF